MNNRTQIILVLLLILFGCSRKEEGKTVVAKLDNKVLTLEEIRGNVDTTIELTDAIIYQYIQRWLIEEALYREAVEKGLDRTMEINQKVENVRKQLSINALLEKEVYSKEPGNFTDEEIKRYYNEHIKEFNLTNDVVLVSFVLFRDRDAATQFRNLVLKGTNWKSAVEQMLPSVLAVVDSSYETQASLVPSELWRVATNAVSREISFPINTRYGYYVLVVWKSLRQGQTADLPIVREEILNRLTVQRRQKLFEDYMNQLRSKHTIQVFLKTTADTINSEKKE